MASVVQQVTSEPSERLIVGSKPYSSSELNPYVGILVVVDPDFYHRRQSVVAKLSNEFLFIIHLSNLPCDIFSRYARRSSARQLANICIDIYAHRSRLKYINYFQSIYSPTSTKTLLACFLELKDRLSDKQVGYLRQMTWQTCFMRSCPSSGSFVKEGIVFL